MKTSSVMLMLVCTAMMGSSLVAATNVSADITTDTTWNSGGSPYNFSISPKVRNGATLTIDSSGGPVEVNFDGAGVDFQIGNGVGDEGYLHLNAESGSITFRMWNNCNLVVNDYGQVTTTDATATTYFENYGTGTGSEQDWGGIDFIAGQQHRSHLVNCDFSGGGYDGKDGALVIRDTEVNTPQLEDLTFDDCNVSAIRFDGNGVNALRQDGFKLPFNVTNTDYVFWLNEVTSTASIRFPDPDSPAAPEAKLSGTCTVGDSSNVSHWRFDDAYTFKCAASSKIDVVSGSVWGTEEARPTFESISGSPGQSDWNGIQDVTIARANVFGGTGPFAFLTVRDALYGVRYEKYTGTSPLTNLTLTLPGIVAKHCDCGIYLRTKDGRVIVSRADVSGPTVDQCVTGIKASPAVATLDNCTIASTSTYGIYTSGDTVGYDMVIRECRISDSGSYGINLHSTQATSSALVERTILDGANRGIAVVQSASYSPDRAVTIRNCCISTSNTAIAVYGHSSSTISFLVENCTMIGNGTGSYGIHISTMGSSSTARVARTHFENHRINAVFCEDTSNDGYEIEFDECVFADNGTGTAQRGGIHDERDANAKVTAVECTFVGNSPYGAYDDNGGSAATDMLAANCYWGAADGPGGSGPGSGDAVNANVDYVPFLTQRYIGALIGGSPASASEWDVWENSTTNGDNLHIMDNTPYFKWTFASDFEGDTQSAYHIEVDDDADFSSTLWDTTKTADPAADNVEYAGTSLSDGTTYYARIRLWNEDDLAGPWRYLTFRLNSAPGQVTNTNRSPSDSSSQSDYTPVLEWSCPTDNDEDPLHFNVYLSAIVGGQAISYEINSFDMSFSSLPEETDARDQFEFSTDGGESWLAVPDDGVPFGVSALVRLTWPDAWGLDDETWSWEVKAFDGFEYGSSSSSWDFDLGRSFSIEGQLQDDAGLGDDGKTVRLYINGVDSGDTDVTSTMSLVPGRFEIATTATLKVGDVLWVYIDGETEKGASVFHFTGQDITYDGDSEDIIVRDQRVYIYGTVAGDIFDNSDFAIVTADADIPWSYSGGTVTFKSSLNGTGDGVHLLGHWDLSGMVDGSTFANVELTIGNLGQMRTLSHDENFYRLVNEGSVEVTDGSTFTINGADSTTSRRLVIDASTFEFFADSVLTLTVDAGVLTVRNGAKFLDTTANVSEVIVDTATTGERAVFDCTDTEFDEVRVTFEDDGVLGVFNDNTFISDISTQHIHWKSTSSLSATQMRGVQFDVSVDGSSTFNVKASAGANALNMIGSGGIGHGEAFDDDAGDKVTWELTQPTGLSLSVGDTRIRAEWEAHDATDASVFGYNLYTSYVKDGNWTSDLSYSGGTNRTTFTNANASFTSDLVGESFYPDGSSGTTLTVAAVPSSTTIEVVGDHVSTASEGVRYSFFVKVNGSLLGATDEVADSLTNATPLYFYVTIDDSTEDLPADRVQSLVESATPAAAAVDALAPEESPADSVLALSVLGDATHWEASTTVTITKGGGSGVTVNDTTVISPTLVLVDATLAGATTGTWMVTASEDDVWGISAYDESDTSDLTVNATDASDDDRPTLSFSTNNGGIADDADTSGSFTLNIDFTDQGEGVDTATLEIYASREVTIANSGEGAGTELVDAGLSIDTLNDSRATVTINQTAGTELFDDGEYVVTARVADDSGNFSEWASRRFFVEGGSSDVVKVDHSGGEVVLYQGKTQVVTLTGTSLGGAVDFGADIDVISTSGSGGSMDVTLDVGHLAACGPREFTTNSGANSGVAVVEYPTNILPTVTNAEPPRNAAVAGVSVLLANGAFFTSETDIATRGRMIGLSWSRFYRSDISFNGPLGHGWVGENFQTVTIAGNDDILWYTPDGRKETFESVTGGYSSPAGVYLTATSESTHDTITLTDRHGFRCVFNSEGRLWRCIDRNENSTECAYNHAGQLVSMTDDRGKSWTIEYHDHGRVSKVVDKVWDDTTPREVEYEYDSKGNLIEQKAPETERYDDVSGNRITSGYRYDGQHRLIARINPREFNDGAEPEPYLQNFYDSSGRVTDQRLGSEADVIDTHITKSAFIRLRYVDSTTVREIDRNGLRTDYSIDGQGRTTEVKRFTGFYSVDTDEPINHSTVSTEMTKLRSGDPTSFDTTFTYNGSHEITDIEYPRGNTVEYTYPDATSQVSATADSCSGTLLTDSSQSWSSDAFVGMTLRMGSDVGDFAYYPIASNTGTTITVEAGFDLQADGWDNDDYSVLDGNEDPMAAGNVLKVTRTDGSVGPLADLVTEFTYEPRYQLVKSVTDPRSNTTNYTYDYEESNANDVGAGNLVKVETPTITGSMASSGTIATQTSYNQFGQPVTAVDGEGNVTRLVYHASGSQEGFLKHSIGAWGELNLKTEYEYDPVGNLTASWSPRAFEAGATKDDFKTAYEVNELNQTWHTTSRYEVGDPTGSTLASVDSYRYFDANGNLTQSFGEYITHGGNAPSAPSDPHDPTTFSKNANAMAATWVETSHEYNLLNYQTQSTQDAIAGNTITRYTHRTEYDSNYNAVASITPLGHRTHTIYDERNMTFQRIQGAESDVEGTYRTDYDANGNVVSSFDALGNETTYTYDGFDRTVKVTDPAGHYRTTTYDANSNVTESKAYEGLDNTVLTHSKSTYDEINRAYKSERLAEDHNGNDIGDGWNTSVTVFDKNSRVVSSTNDNGVTHRKIYDGANRVVRTLDAVGNETHPHYNAHGATTRVDYLEINGLNQIFEKSHVEYVLNRSDVAWEVRNRRWSSNFDTSGHASRDGWGRVVVSTDADGTETTQFYDLLSRKTRTERVPGSGSEDTITSIEYDDDSRTTVNRINVGDPTNLEWQETRYMYDERNRIIEKHRADGDLFTYSYDENSNQTGWTDPLGNKVTNTYDERNLIDYREIDRASGVSGDIPPTLGTTYESYEYDGLGRLDSCSNYEGDELISSSDWQYNTLSLPEVQTQTVGRMLPLLPSTYPRQVTTGQKSFTVKVQYDATGLVVGNTGWDGRKTESTYDQLDRLLTVTDAGSNEMIATHLYAGSNRLVERTSGNGTRTSIEYEASGCGCGGSTGFVERVEHADKNGNVIFATNRVHDELGNVKAENQDHWGEIGQVYAYDNTYRLTNAFQGIDLWEDSSNTNRLSTWKTSSSLPSVKDGIAANTVYRLDERGNRTKVEQWLDTSTGSVRDVDYTADDEMNTYTEVDGQTFEFDENDQRIYDPTTGLYSAYDYKGQLVAQATNANMTSPVKTYDHDNQGRLLLEDNADDPEFGLLADQTVSVNTVGAGGGCGCSGNASGDPKTADLVLNQEGTLQSVTNYDFGEAISAAGSGQTFSAFTVPGPSGPGTGGDTPVHDEVWIEFFVDRYNHENQLGSLIGTSDEDGLPEDELNYSEYGEPLAQKIAFSAAPENIQSVSYNSTHKETTINFTGVTAPANMDGMEVRVAVPGDGTKRYRTARVQHGGGSSLVLWEPTAGGGETVEDAVDPNGSINAGLVVYDNPSGMLDGRWEDVDYDPFSDTTTFEDTDRIFSSHHDSVLVELKIGVAGAHLTPDDAGGNVLEVDGDVTDLVSTGDRYRAPDLNWQGNEEEANSGIWLEAPTYDSGSDRTTFYAEPSATFKDHQVGWKLMPNSQRPSYYEITAVNDTEIEVAGDLTNPDIADADGDWFRVITPYGLDSDTGRLPENPWPETPRASTWAGYRYMPPAVGFSTSLGTPTGLSQTGDNEQGSYYAFNRTYDPSQGRWTTPDPAASPWGNLQDYVGSSPLLQTDPSGLDIWVERVLSPLSLGIHKRLCADECISEEGSCLYKTQRFCISFGPKWIPHGLIDFRADSTEERTRGSELLGFGMPDSIRLGGGWFIEPDGSGNWDEALDQGGKVYDETESSLLHVHWWETQRYETSLHCQCDCKAANKVVAVMKQMLLWEGEYSIGRGRHSGNFADRLYPIMTELSDAAKHECRTESMMGIPPGL